jgi:Spy/CpxP family protein refolding chaperone
MKFRFAKPVLAAAILAAAGLTYAGQAVAETGKSVERCEKGWSKGDFKKRAEERMNRLRQDLKLTADQEAAWTTWTGKVTASLEEAKAKRPDFKAMSDLSAPERMEKYIGYRKEKQARMEAGLADLKAFYATLTPEQRKVFDKSSPFGHGRDKGKKSEKK